MLKSRLLHPEILSALGRNGHGSRILIADGNFPFSTCPPLTAQKVFLNLAPGIVGVTDVLEVITDHIPVESAMLMVPPDESTQPVHDEFAKILGDGVPVAVLKRQEFYAEVRSSDTCLVIATGETRRFANILLVIGVVKA